MTARPAQWGPQHASAFDDSEVARRYSARPPYARDAITFLRGLIDPSSYVVLDLGTGTGKIARELAPTVARVDAVDMSAPMLAEGKRLADSGAIRWIHARVEDADLVGPYGLATAGASLHWMEWDVVLPRFGTWLAPESYLAIVEDITLANPWDAEVGPVLARYSMNKDFQPYNMLTIAQELERRGLFQQVGMRTTDPAPFQQTAAGWVESWHARNGFSRDRMGPTAARECDDRLMAIIDRHCPTGVVEQRTMGRVIWGWPRAGYVAG